MALIQCVSPISQSVAPGRRLRDPDEITAFRRGLVGFPTLLFIVLLYLLPLAFVIQLSFQTPQGWGLAHFERLFTTEVYLRVMWKTAWVSAVVTLIDLLLAYPLAMILNRAKGWGYALLMVAILTPIWTNLLVRAYGWIVILHPAGLINTVLLKAGIVEEPVPLVHTTTGVIIGMTQIMLPYMILPIAAQIGKMDMRLIHAARSLGASAPRTFIHVFLPLTLPGVFAGCLIVFVMSLGYLVVPALLGGQRGIMLAQLIDINFTTVLNWEFGAALATVLLLSTIGLFLIAQRWFRLDTMWLESR